MAGNFYMGSPGGPSSPLLPGNEGTRTTPAAPTSPLKPGNEGTAGGGTATPMPPSNVLPGQGIRPTGPSQGFDPAFLQNLATYVGGLFANPGSSSTLSFNPLGNLSEISPPSGMGGNAPNPGEPITWLQQALAGLPFSYSAPSTSGTTGTASTTRPPMGGPRYPTNPRLTSGL